jgi:hypothetical protein
MKQASVLGLVCAQWRLQCHRPLGQTVGSCLHCFARYMPRGFKVVCFADVIWSHKTFTWLLSPICPCVHVSRLRIVIMMMVMMVMMMIMMMMSCKSCLLYDSSPICPCVHVCGLINVMMMMIMMMTCARTWACTALQACCLLHQHLHFSPLHVTAFKAAQ